MTTLDWAALVKDAGDVSTGFPVLPEGKYLLEVAEVKVKTTSTGKTMFNLKIKVAGGEKANSILWDNLVISPESQKALEMVFTKIYSMGIPKEFFQRQPAPTNEDIANVMVGRRFIGTVAHDTYKGELKNVINRYSPVEDASSPAAAAVVPPVAVAPAPSSPAPSGPPPVAVAPAPAPAAPSAPF